MFTGGQIFVSSPPTFSDDGKKLLVCTGCTVSVFSTSTGLQINELTGGHSDRVTSVVVLRGIAASCKFTSYCWTSSLDATICYWDFVSAELIRKVIVQFPIHSMVIPSILTSGTGGEASDNYAFVSVEGVSTSVDENKVVHGQIRIFNLTNSRCVGGLMAKTRTPELLYVSKNGEFVGFANKRKIHIWMIPVKDFRFYEIRKIKLHHTKSLTCLAFHPNLRMVAGGDATGRILIWIGFGRRKFARDSQITSEVKNAIDEEKPGVWHNDDAASCSTWHWHSSAVKFLYFSTDGAYLYSGGKEGVIVVWQLDTGKKIFKPRLGSPLLYFTQSPDPSLSCVSCSSNRIHLLKMPTLEITKSISGIKPPFSFPVEHGSCTQVAYDWTAGVAAVLTGDYCVQFYNLFDNHEVSEVQVCKRNFQPADDVRLYVALVSISADGSLMGTVDVKLPEESLGGLVSLKFWMRSSLVGEYSLSTVVYEPHSDAGVSCLAFRPGHGMAISTSFGGEFKVWVHGSHIMRADSSMQKTGWRCQSIGSYKEKPLTAAAFSADGSVLAIAAETVITLWDPDTNVLVAVIGDTHSPIKQLSFIGKSEYLVSLAYGLKPQLAVWRTTNSGLYWSYKLVAEALSSSNDESKFAVLVLANSPCEINGNENGVILLFDVENPVPMATWMVKKAKGGSVAFLPANTSFHGAAKASDRQKQPLLVYMNRDHEYIIFDPHGDGDYRTCKNTQDSQLNIEESERFGYASIYGDLSRFKSKQEEVPEIAFVPSERPWETIFGGSSHILPPLTKLCSTFLESLLEKRGSVLESYT